MTPPACAATSGGSRVGRRRGSRPEIQQKSR